VTKKIFRNYLEIKSVLELRETKNPPRNCFINFLHKPDFQLNKFFYKNIGKNHNWVDRLNWTEKQWMDYVNSNNLKTFVLIYQNEIAGYFESLYHHDDKEIEIAYFGILEEYHNKKLGSYLLSFAIKKSFENNIKRVWVHTCSYDHKNALNNYLKRGMKIIKSETVFM
tara:strand:- start:130 stop:633 length:504 start_codon:yes stop_codon:yes gene_type:complete